MNLKTSTTLLITLRKPTGGNEYSFDAHNSDGEFSCIGGLVKQYKSGSSDIHFLVRDAITLAVTIKSAKINPNIVSTDET